MALTMKDTGLVQGVPLTGTPLTTVKALRGFVDEQGQTHAKGEIVLCSERFARGVIATGKAERAHQGGIVKNPDPVPLVGEVPSEETVPTPVVPEPAPPEPKKRRSKFAKGDA